MLGQSRVAAVANSGCLTGTKLVVSSAETKALETANPLAETLGCSLIVRKKMHENDRSATVFLPSTEFEAVVDQFFAHPDTSVRGWETAAIAQSRIATEVQECIRSHPDGDILFVGHGGVGTLLFCHLSGLPISRDYDQGIGGGCYFEFHSMQSKPMSPWQPMERMWESD